MDNRSARIAVLIPCFNEAPTIGKVVEDFRRELPEAEIYVFDNNSRDGSAAIAAGHGARVVPETRQGKGYVVSGMFERVEADLYVMVDGDDTYPAASVHDLLAPLRRGEADMVVGARLRDYVSRAFRPMHVLGNTLVVRLVNRIFGSRLTDVLSGYRAFTRELVKNLPLSARGFEVETQMVMQSLFYNYRIAEVDIAYGARPRGSHSKLNTVRDGAIVLFAIFNVAKAYRPLAFFSLVAALFGLAGLGLGSIPVVEWLRTGFITHLPTAVLATGLVLASMLFFAAGVILDVVNFRLREINYLLRKKL